MDLGITGRRAAVAAGSAGLGLATARALAAEGVQIAICGRSAERLAEAAAEIGAGTITIPADLSDPSEGPRFVDEAALALGGPIDILIANAGGPPPGLPSSTSIEAYAAAFELNCLASIAMCLGAVGPMRAQGWGRIVAITSIGARQPIPGLAASSVARAAMTSFIKTLATEVAPDGVTANTVQPGSHATERITSLHGDSSAMLADIPVGRLGDPADFGSVTTFLCSVHASFVSGAAIVVDGGASRGLQ